LEKAAELGAARLQPIHCRRSVVTAKAGPVARQRWQAICASAVRQSGQTYLPEILPPAQFGDVLSAGMNGFGLIAHTGPDTCTVSAAMGQCSEENITLLIGPEGGWTDDELREAVTAGYRPVRLGQTTLRVETAAVALTAAVIALYR